MALERPARYSGGKASKAWAAMKLVTSMRFAPANWALSSSDNRFSETSTAPSLEGGDDVAMEVRKNAVLFLAHFLDEEIGCGI